LGGTVSKYWANRNAWGLVGNNLLEARIATAGAGWGTYGCSLFAKECVIGGVFGGTIPITQEITDSVLLQDHKFGTQSTIHRALLGIPVGVAGGVILGAPLRKLFCPADPAPSNIAPSNELQSTVHKGAQPSPPEALKTPLDPVGTGSQPTQSLLDNPKVTATLERLRQRFKDGEPVIDETNKGIFADFSFHGESGKVSQKSWVAKDGTTVILQAQGRNQCVYEVNGGTIELERSSIWYCPTSDTLASGPRNSPIKTQVRVRNSDELREVQAVVFEAILKDKQVQQHLGGWKALNPEHGLGTRLYSCSGEYSKAVVLYSRNPESARMLAERLDSILHERGVISPTAVDTNGTASSV